MADYSCKKLFHMTYPIARIHPLQRDRQMNRWTDRRTKNMPIAQPLL